MISGAVFSAATILALASGPAFEVTSEGPFQIGDAITVRVTAPMSDEGSLRLPEWGTTWGDAEIREVGPVETETTKDGERVVTQKVTITFFDRGEFALPVPRLGAIARDGEGESTEEAPAALPLRVRIESVLPEGEELPAAKPPAPPRQLGWGRPFTWTAVALALASLVAIAAVLRRERSAFSAGGTEPREPLELLLGELRELQAETDGEMLFTSLSFCLRKFLGVMLAFPAIESTTSEIRRRLKAGDLSSQTITRTERLLRRCDGVKFARLPVAASDSVAAIAEAEGIALETAQALAPPESDETEEGR